ARRTLDDGLALFHRIGGLDGEWRCQFALGRAAEREGDVGEARRRYRIAATLDGKLRERVPDPLRVGFGGDPTRCALARAAGAPAETAASRPSLTVVRDSAPTDPWGERYRRIVGRHPRLRQVFALLDKVAPSESLVLIRGESGTGKELIADAIH